MAQILNPHNLPLSLYIHIPWCVKKCPYCDFNSHNKRHAIPYDDYIQSLLDDFKAHFDPNRRLTSIFFGGGTPSLFPGDKIGYLLEQINRLTPLPSEITLEMNPGTLERDSIQAYRQAGITRISLGVQSFDDQMLQKIGRIHNSEAVHIAISEIKNHFDNWNLDLMYGLPEQSVDSAMHDLTTALAYTPSHLSWYQLTLEPNTKFYHQRPPLPDEENLYDMFVQGHQLLDDYNFNPYEVSAFTQSKVCRHNLNYWQFGDYLGIGAGAHSKLTSQEGILRSTRFRHPQDYLSKRPFMKSEKWLAVSELPFEFMLNTLRLTDGFNQSLFEQTTGLNLNVMTPILRQAQAKDLIQWQEGWIRPTQTGKLYLNDLMAMFLEDEHTSPISNQS